VSIGLPYTIFELFDVK